MVLSYNLQHSCLLLLLLLIFCVLLQASHHVQKNLQNLQPDNNTQPYRTAFHFQPKKNWMNDPNAPMVYMNTYHLFYQYNPKGAVWGNIVWGHFTSKDLVNWDSQPIAIVPSQESDINGCWSGSSTLLSQNKPVIVYTGINTKKSQTQNLAFPHNHSDANLKQWDKFKSNPIIEPTSQNHIEPSSFRDPSTAWIGDDSIWRLIIGSKMNERGMAILYKSSNFLKWKEAGALYSTNRSGIWECPDFYPVSIGVSNGVDTSAMGRGLKHVLKVSLDETKHDYYLLGKYDAKRDKFTPALKRDQHDEWGARYDYGEFYASKTFFDSEKKRRILWGWINESSTEIEDIKKGWSGIQAIPRKLWLHRKNKQLMQWPVEEIEKLRLNNVQLSKIKLEGRRKLAINNITAAQADVEVVFNLTGFENTQEWKTSWNKKNPVALCSQNNMHGGFGLHVLASKGLKEFTSVFFMIFTDHNKRVVLMCSDQTRSSLDKDDDKPIYGSFINLESTQQQKLSLRTLIDHSVVESFGGEGMACITARVYPTLAIDNEAYLYAFNNGPDAVEILSLTAWSMNKAKII